MIFDDLGRQLSEEYGLFLLALTARYQQLRAPGVEVTPRAVSDLSYDAHELAAVFYRGAGLTAERYLQSLCADASERVADGLVERKMVVLALVRAMLLENVAQVVKLAKTGKRLANYAGALGLLIQSQAGRIDFKAADAAGRKWDAKRLLWVVVRDFAYQAWLDVRFESLQRSGAALVAVNDDILPLEELVERRAEFFHVNSKAVPTHHVPS